MSHEPTAVLFHEGARTPRNITVIAQYAGAGAVVRVGPSSKPCQSLTQRIRSQWRESVTLTRSVREKLTELQQVDFLLRLGSVPLHRQLERLISTLCKRCEHSQPLALGGAVCRDVPSLGPVVKPSLRGAIRSEACTLSNRSGPMSLFRKRDFLPVCRLVRCA